MAERIDSDLALAKTDFAESELLELSFSATKIEMIMLADITALPRFGSFGNGHEYLKFEFLGKHGGLEAVSSTVRRNSCPPPHLEEPYRAGLGAIKNLNTASLPNELPPFRYRLDCEWAFDSSLSFIYEECRVTVLDDSEINART